MITGHVRHEHGPELVQALLSNYQDGGRGHADVAARDVVTTYFSAKRDGTGPTLVQRIGDYRLVTHQRAEELRSLLVPSRPASAIVGLLADRWPLWTTGAAGVGATLNSLVLPADPALDPLWRFHSDKVSGRWVAGNTVTCSPNESLAVRGLTVTVEEDGPPLTVPAVPKRHRCPCGSGRMYGRCHRQR